MVFTQKITSQMGKTNLAESIQQDNHARSTKKYATKFMHFSLKYIADQTKITDQPENIEISLKEYHEYLQFNIKITKKYNNNIDKTYHWKKVGIYKLTCEVSSMSMFAASWLGVTNGYATSTFTLSDAPDCI